MGDRSAKRRATGNLEAIGVRSAKWRPTGNPNHSSSMADRSARRRAMGNLEAADEDLEGGHGGGVPNFVQAWECVSVGASTDKLIGATNPVQAEPEEVAVLDAAVGNGVCFFVYLRPPSLESSARPRKSMADSSAATAMADSSPPTSIQRISQRQRQRRLPYIVNQESTTYKGFEFTGTPEGIPSQAEYCSAAGKPWPLANWKFYIAFSLFRCASILAGVYRRWIMVSPLTGARTLQLGVIGDPDPEPSRCRRTDGKKWRCSKGAAANRKYCDRHLNRGRHCSRKLVEGHASHAASLVFSNACLPTASSEYGAGSSNSLSIAQLPGEILQPSSPNFPPMQLNRMQMSEHNANICVGNSQDLSMQGSEPAPFEGSSSLPPLPDSVLASEDPLLNLPTRSFSENTRFLPSFQMNSEAQKSVHALSSKPHALSSQPHAEYHGIPNVSSELPSCSSSPFPENLTFSPLNLSGDFASFDVGQDIEHGQNVMTWDPIACDASVDGPIGEVLANNINMPSEEMSNSLPSDLTTEEWDLSPWF